MENPGKRKLKLFFDLNGTTIYRSQTEQHYPGEKKLKNRYITLRPGIIQALHDLSPYYDFYVYSSMTKDNIDETIKEFFKDIQFEGIFDREWNKKDPNAVKGWETVRDLPRVWKNLEDKNINSTNSILIENEQRKVEEYKSNALIVRTIDAAELHGGKTDVAKNVCKYLISIAQKYEDDVTKVLEKYPYVDEVLTREFEKLGIPSDSKIGHTMLEIAYINDKEVCLTNFKVGMTIKVKLPLKPGIQIDQKMPYSFILVNMLNHESSYSS